MVLDCDSAFLDGVTDETATPETWTVAVLVRKETVEFKLDTGAEVTATSDFSFRKLKGIHLQKQSKVLHKMDLIVLRYLFWDSSHNYSLLRTRPPSSRLLLSRGLMQLAWLTCDPISAACGTNGLDGKQHRAEYPRA